MRSSDHTESRSLVSPLTLFMTAGLIALLVYLAILAGRTGLADLYYSRANRFLNSWSVNRTPPSPEQWSAVQGVMDNALELDRGNPKILDALGRVARWGGTVETQSAPQAVAPRADALDYFRRSLASRPSSPFTWANLVLAKYAEGQTGAEFEHALRMTAHSGPWIAASQTAVANAGLGAWEALRQDASREAVRDTVIRGLAWPGLNPDRQPHAENIWKIVVYYDRSEMVCGWKAGTSALAHWCGDDQVQDG